MGTHRTEKDQKKIDGNTKHRSYAFTWNNYTKEDIEYLKRVLNEGEYLFGEEIGNTGTLHLQGAVRWKNPRQWKGIVELFKKNHVEPTRNWKKLKNYCKKDGIIHTNIIKELTRREMGLKIEYENVEWRNWQKEVLRICELKPHPRKVYWIYSEEGNKGKSFLCKYISLKYKGIVCSGKSGDIFNQARIWVEENEKIWQLPICIVDVSRSEYGHVNYAAIEQLKNGHLYSGKYEGGKVIGGSPHIFIFANNAPKENELSKDRWEIIKI